MRTDWHVFCVRSHCSTESAGSIAVYGQFQKLNYQDHEKPNYAFTGLLWARKIHQQCEGIYSRPSDAYCFAITPLHRLSLPKNCLEMMLWGAPCARSPFRIGSFILRTSRFPASVTQPSQTVDFLPLQLRHKVSYQLSLGRCEKIRVVATPCCPGSYLHATCKLFVMSVAPTFRKQSRQRGHVKAPFVGRGSGVGLC